MLSRKIPKLKLDLKSKGRSRYILLRKYLLPGIPVLSIFALVGIFCYGIIVGGVAEDTNGKAYAEEGITPLADTSASLTVDDGKIKDTIFATSGEFAYASHKINVEANNIKSYSLTLTRNIDLTGPTGGEGNSGVVGANGKTPDQMDNAWGYAFINDGADPTSATYQTLASSNTLSGPAIDSNHNLSGSKQLVFGAKFGSSAMSGTNCTSTLNTTSDEESYNYTISSTTPTRSGYEFLGYNTSNTTTANANYAPGKTVTLTAASPTLMLYAVWEEFFPITTMQQMTVNICTSASVGATKNLTDSRNNKSYTITKLTDGNCWMTSNLALELSGITLSSATSDVVSNWPSTTGASGKWNTTTSTSENIIKYYNGSADSTWNSSYGYYYSWGAASAGANSMTSICPKGWKLPTKAQFEALLTSAGITKTDNSGAYKITSLPYNFILAGDIGESKLNSPGTAGKYWANDGSFLHMSMDLTTKIGTTFTYTDKKYYGRSVRCIAAS